MQQFTRIFEFRTSARGLLEITQDIERFVAQCGVSTGLLTLFCRHTSASLLIQENAAREVRRDLEAFFEKLAPEDPARYAHSEEGPDDMPAHIRTALTNVHLAIPVIDGRLALGAWQGIYLFEHRRAPHRRTIAAHLIGD
jgi:secondary thiamine-phosphate synthase enzyme